MLTNRLHSAGFSPLQTLFFLLSALFFFFFSSSKQPLPRFAGAAWHHLLVVLVWLGALLQATDLQNSTCCSAGVKNSNIRRLGEVLYHGKQGPMKVQYVPNEVQGGKVKILVYWSWKAERGLAHGDASPSCWFPGGGHRPVSPMQEFPLPVARALCRST